MKIAIIAERGASGCTDLPVRHVREKTTMAIIDERCAHRCADLPIGSLRDETAMELMSESGKSRHAEFTVRLERRFPRVTRTPSATKVTLAK